MYRTETHNCLQITLNLLFSISLTHFSPTLHFIGTKGVKSHGENVKLIFLFMLFCIAPKNVMENFSGITEIYSKPCEISKMERFAKIVNGF